jgi:hypothetical protein
MNKLTVYHRLLSLTYRYCCFDSYCFAVPLLQVSVWFLNYRQRNKEKLHSNLKKAAPRKHSKNNRGYESD